MAEVTTANIGTSSHLGQNQLTLDGHFVHDYTQKRVSVPFVSYMGIADTLDKETPTELNGKWALGVLQEYLNPAGIAEEEVNGDRIRSLIEEAFQKVNQRLIQECRNRNLDENYKLSMTAVLTSASHAYIGHAGDCRVYLDHDMKLFDVTPCDLCESNTIPQSETPTLFEVHEMTFMPSSEDGGLNINSIQPGNSKTIQTPAKGRYLGESDEVDFGFSQIEIVPEDILILCSDGFHNSIIKEEIAENFHSSGSLERGANQLIRLALSRNSEDNATIAAWRFTIQSTPQVADDGVSEAKIPKTTGEKLLDSLVFVLLGLVLCGILAIGFAFGWRIADAFKQPQEEAAQSAPQPESENDAKEESVPEEEESVVLEIDPQAPVTKVAIVDGNGVRMRNAAGTEGSITGTLNDGQEVTLLEEIDGSDGRKWSRISGTVRYQGKDEVKEGYVLSEFLKTVGDLVEDPSPGTTLPSPRGTTP
ncbi:MAG: SH3 domain-containing protein [Actinobacteria bacterium]|nr:SH3 domain-containing protein [Actinomycetota bacterium]